MVRVGWTLAGAFDRFSMSAELSLTDLHREFLALRVIVERNPTNSDITVPGEGLAFQRVSNVPQHVSPPYIRIYGQPCEWCGMLETEGFRARRALGLGWSQPHTERRIQVTQAEQGDVVKVKYTGKLEDGTVFASTDHGTVQFRIGEHKVMPGFEEAIIGMTPEESKTVKVPSEKAYGRYNSAKVRVVSREGISSHVTPRVGARLQVRQEDGQTAEVRITNVSQSMVTLDANHPLAGKDLVFEIQLVSIIRSLEQALEAVTC